MTTCSIDECNKPSKSKKGGLCQMHYLRHWRHGDVNHRDRVANNETSEWIKDIAIHHTGDTCLTWPFNRMGNGYGSSLYKGKNAPAHRIVCILAHGEPPTPKHYAAHECGNGHLGCVNPRHLTWKTPKENAADKLKHGTHNRGERFTRSKLTKENVLEIRSLRGKMHQKDIAAMFGVTRMTVSAVVNRQIWKWLD